VVARKNDGQQSGGEEKFAAARRAGPVEQWAQDQMTKEDDPQYGDETRAERPGEQGDRRGIATGQADQDQQGNRGQILEQQDGKGRAAERCRFLAAAMQDIHHDRRRGQSQAEPDQCRGLQIQAEGMGAQGECSSGQRHLEPTQAEDILRQGAKPLQRQFKADGEQQKGDAEFRGGVQRWCAFDQPKPMRTEHYTQQQVTDDGVDAQPMRAQQHDDDCRKHDAKLPQHHVFGLSAMSELGHGACRGPIPDRFIIGAPARESTSRRSRAPG
jgi:hypothetical protein